jgi:hypothetical protein
VRSCACAHADGVLMLWWCQLHSAMVQHCDVRLWSQGRWRWGSTGKFVPAGSTSAHIRVQSCRSMCDETHCAAGGNMGMDSFASGGHPGIGMGRRERRKMDARDEQTK